MASITSSLMGSATENRPGDSSMLAAETVARVTPDGYMLRQHAQSGVDKSKFNPGKGLAPIAPLGVVPSVLVANPSVPSDNLKELSASAKSKPESVTFGPSGTGTAGHMAAELFNDELFNEKAGTKILIVP